MEYVYAALILHQAGKKVDENGIKKIIESAGIKADDAKIKALKATTYHQPLMAKLKHLLS